jgi:heme-degrading monooxygenase HmoA
VKPLSRVTRRSLLADTLLLSIAGETARAASGNAEPYRPALVSPRWARVWQGSTRIADFDAYAAYLYEEGCKAIEAIPGNLGVQMLRRTVGNRGDFEVISYWPDLETIKSFAGEDISLAHPLAKDAIYLLKLPRRVEHFELYSRG